jgi:hypothetical protein
MILTWSKIYLITALRVLKPFLRKHGFKLSELEYGSRDGGYIEFLDSANENIAIRIIYNPGFDILVRKKGYFKVEEVSLIKLKRQCQGYSDLPEDYNGEEELKEILSRYMIYFESEVLSNLRQ